MNRKAEPCCEHCAEKMNIRLVHEDEHHDCCEPKKEHVDFCEQEHGHGHESEHAHEHGEGGALSTRLLIGGAIVFAAGMVFETAGAFGWAGIPRLIVFLAAYLLVGGEILIGAGRGIARGHVFDENFLMAVASIGAFAIGEMPEGVAVMLFYRIGEAFEERAVDHSTRAISALMEVRPEHAYVLTDGVPTRTDPRLVAVGSLIAVRPGERVPLDGVVREGVSSLDTSALTGESMPRRVEPGDEALAGAVNTSGLLTMEVTRPFGESAVVKILKLVQEAGARKAPAENFITKFARYYTPIVVICAVILAFIPPLFAAGAAVSGGGAGVGSGAGGEAGVGFAEAYGQIFFDWVERALIFLVISCPCALVISIPLSYFGGIGGASRQGILVKGGNYLEALARTETVVFDKTGTLTRGKIRVSEVLPVNGVSENELLKLAAAAEQSSTHPIALAIVASAREKGLDIPPASDVSEAAGRGATCFVDREAITEGAAGAQEAIGVAVNQNGLQEMRVEIRAGSQRLLEEAGAAPPAELCAGRGTGTVCHIAVGGRYTGSIRLADELRPDSKTAVSDLRAAGVKRLYMLTGDNTSAAAAVCEEIGLDGYYANLLPHQKVERLEELGTIGTAQKATLAFVGDGINDAPVLARADIGVAMGGIGSDAAIEAADAVIMADEPSRLAVAIRVAKKTHAIVTQNIIFALGVKAILLVLGALGLANMWMAVFGDVGVAAICVLNSLRALRTR